MAAAYLFDGPEGAALTVALAHGAGAPMDSPFMAAFAEGLAAEGFRVCRFEFPYMETSAKHGMPREFGWRGECWLCFFDPACRFPAGVRALGGLRVS